MSIEKPYQPTKEDVKKAEDMMTEEEKQTNTQRFEQKEKEDLKAREKIMQFKDRIIDIENPKISVNVDLIIKGVVGKRFATIRKFDSKGIYINDDREFVGFEKIEDLINREW